jgi:hypothetical protein
MDLSLLGSLAVSSGITVGALKEATIGDIEGGNSLEATELSGRKYSSLSQFRDKSLIIQSRPFHANRSKL